MLRLPVFPVLNHKPNTIQSIQRYRNPVEDLEVRIQGGFPPHEACLKLILKIARAFLQTNGGKNKGQDPGSACLCLGQKNELIKAMEAGHFVLLQRASKGDTDMWCASKRSASCSLVLAISDLIFLCSRSTGAQNTSGAPCPKYLPAWCMLFLLYLQATEPNIRFSMIYI